MKEKIRSLTSATTGIVLSVSKSRRAFLLQFVFLTINVLGLVCGTIFNAATPDLYPGNAHHKMGWILTWISVAQGLMALLNTYGGRWNARSQQEERIAFIPVSTEAMAEHQRNSRPVLRYASRFSADSGQGTERNTESLLSHSSTPSLENNQLNISDSHHEFEEPDEVEKQAPKRSGRLDQYLTKKLSGLSQFRILRIFDVLYDIVDRVMLILAFVAYLTGLVTYGGIFVSLFDLVTSRISDD